MDQKARNDATRQLVDWFKISKDRRSVSKKDCNVESPLASKASNWVLGAMGIDKKGVGHAKL
jgi:hypothetical protein